MFLSIRKFIKHHQRKLVIGGTIIGGTMLLTHYVQRKIREWQESEIKGMLERVKKRNHFEHLEKTCNNIIIPLALSIRNTIIKKLDTKSIINQLKHGAVNKIALWNELKILSITRSAVIIYAYTILITFVRIQINLISGYTYTNQTMNNVAGYDVQAKYLQLSTYFISEGVQKLCNMVKCKVEQITASVSLNDQLTLRDFEEICWGITSSIYADNLSDPIKNFADYIILQKDDKDKEMSIYSKIIDQTLDLLESEEVQNLIQRNIRSGFALLIDHISVHFGAFPKNENGILLPGTSSQENPNSQEAVIMNNGSNEFIDINKTTMPMAKIIPIVNRQVSDDPVPKDTTAEWLERLMLNNEIIMLGANIYEAFGCQNHN